MARVIQFHKTGGLEVLQIDEVDIGAPGPGELRRRVHAFGLNRAEAFRDDIYGRYLALMSVHALRDELAYAGIKSKRRTRPDGAAYGGQKLSRGILQNRLYRGEISHKSNSYPGEHPAIVDKPLWDDVQAVLAANRVERATGARARHPKPADGHGF